MLSYGSHGSLWILNLKENFYKQLFKTILAHYSVLMCYLTRLKREVFHVEKKQEQ